VSNLITRGVRTHGDSHAKRFADVRTFTEQLAEPLSAEDQTVQSMADASPTKWHLAHTTWFFETFVLAPHARGYRTFDPVYEYLFNSYYEAVGPRHPRPQRGMITRPGAAEIMAYRRHVSDAMTELLESGNNAIDAVVELGLHHEQQHQELILMDAKHLLSLNPLKPAYRAAIVAAQKSTALAWRDFEGGLCEIGLRQRRAASSRLAGAFRARLAAGQLRGVSRLHRGWRLPAARVLAIGRMGLRQSTGLDGAALLGEAQRRLAGLHSLGGAAAGSQPSGLPRERLRGRSLRQVGGQAPAARS
jgi:DinB superfamily